MIISRTPFRMSYVGGGTDIKEFYKEETGAVLSTSIDKYMYVSVHSKFDAGIRIAYSRTEEVNFLHEIEHPLVRETLKLLELKGGLEITSTADIPGKGTGLGSSSSYTVGLINALSAHNNISISPQSLAEKACEVEILKCGEPIGKQDQFAAAFGGLKLYEFMPNDKVIVSPVLCSSEFKDLMNDNTLIFYTGKLRSASKILQEQTRVSNEKDKRLTLRRMAKLAYDFKLSIESNDLNSLGNMLHENWNLKKTLTKEISNSFIDEIYGNAISSGALGGKLLGAGAGGFMMFIAPKNKHQGIIKSLSKLRLINFKLESSGSKIIYYGD